MQKWWILLSAVLVILAARSPSPAQEPMDSRDTLSVGYIAVIDMQRMLTDCKPFGDWIEQLRELEQQRRDELRPHQRKIEETRRKLEVFLPGAPQHKQLLREIFVLEAQLDAEEKALQNFLDLAEARLYVAYYNIIKSEVQKFAQRRNIMMVLNRRKPKDDAVDLASAEALFGQKVIYERSIDITSDILDALDEGNAISLPTARLPDLLIVKEEESP